jgi:hypothetical protein
MIRAHTRARARGRTAHQRQGPAAGYQRWAECIAICMFSPGRVCWCGCVAVDVDVGGHARWTCRGSPKRAPLARWGQGGQHSSERRAR